ncbi:tautomerase family protein [soil metagenome]
MPVIRVEMITGRTREQKRALIKELTDGFIKTCGGKPESVQIVLVDVKKEDWGSAGEAMADKYPDKA